MAPIDHAPVHEFGDERRVTILFADIRGSTSLAETRLPYDVVFLLNALFRVLADVIEKSGGYYSDFIGDGLMALFGLDQELEQGARAALRCALTMLEELHRFNHRLAIELHTPLAVGIGIHTGDAVVGRMGPPKTPILSAAGDSVNTTARLESMTKELGALLVVSGRYFTCGGNCHFVSTSGNFFARWRQPAGRRRARSKCVARNFVRRLGNRPSLSVEN